MAIVHRQHSEEKELQSSLSPSPNIYDQHSQNLSNRNSSRHHNRQRSAVNHATQPNGRNREPNRDHRQRQASPQQSNNQRSRPIINQPSHRQPVRRPSDAISGQMVINEFAEEEIRDKTSSLKSRLARKCYGWHNENSGTQQRMGQINNFLQDISNIMDQIKSVREHMDKYAIKMIKLLTTFSLNISKLYDVCTSAYDEMRATVDPHENDIPDRKGYIMQYFEALRIFKDKTHLGFQDVAKRSYKYIHNWAKLHRYQTCITKLFQTTPHPWDNDTFTLTRNKRITAGTYYKAGVWCETVLRRVWALRKKKVPLRNYEAVLDYLYHVDNRNLLESQIRIYHRHFPFHTVELKLTLMQERDKKLYKKLMDDERAAAAEGKKKWREEVTQQIVDLEKQCEAFESKAQNDAEYICELINKKDRYKTLVTKLKKKNKDLLETIQRMRQEYAVNDQVPVPFDHRVDMLETAEIAFCRMFLAERQYAPSLPDEVEAAQEAEDDLLMNPELDPIFRDRNNDFIPTTDALHMLSLATLPDDKQY